MTDYLKIFKDVKVGDRPSARTQNEIQHILMALGKSVFQNGFVDSSGFHSRASNRNGIRFAICAEAAGTGNTITCTLDTTMGQSIEVECEIFYGTDLASCTPELAYGSEIPVAQKSDGSWKCLWWFNGNTECS